MFVVTITQSDGYVFAHTVDASELDGFLRDCEQVINPRYEGITIMAASLYQR